MSISLPQILGDKPISIPFVDSDLKLTRYFDVADVLRKINGKKYIVKFSNVSLFKVIIPESLIHKDFKIIKDYWFIVHDYKLMYHFKRFIEFQCLDDNIIYQYLIHDQKLPFPGEAGVIVDILLENGSYKIKELKS